MQNPRTDIEILKKWFPQLEGIKEALWEVKIFSQGASSVPGPTGFWAKGLIYLQQDQAQKYFSDYEWQEQTVERACETIDICPQQEEIWYYSKMFEDDIKPNTFLGNFYFNGEAVWFDVTK